MDGTWRTTLERLRGVAQGVLVAIVPLTILFQVSRYPHYVSPLRADLQALGSWMHEHRYGWHQADRAVTVLLAFCVAMAPTTPWLASRRTRVAVGLATAAAGVVSCHLWSATLDAATTSWCIVAVGLRAIVYGRVPRSAPLIAGVTGLIAAQPPVAVWLPGPAGVASCSWPNSLLTEALVVVPGLTVFALMLSPTSPLAQGASSADSWLWRTCCLFVALFVADTLLEHGILRLVADGPLDSATEASKSVLGAFAAFGSGAHALAHASTALTLARIASVGALTFGLLRRATRGHVALSPVGSRTPNLVTGGSFTLLGCVIAASLLGRDAVAWTQQEHAAAWALGERGNIMARAEHSLRIDAGSPRRRILWMEPDGSVRDADDGGPPVEPIERRYGGVLMPASATVADFAALAGRVCDRPCDLAWVVPMTPSNALGHALPSRFAIARPLRQQLISTDVYARPPRRTARPQPDTAAQAMDALLARAPNTRLVDLGQGVSLAFVVSGAESPALPEDPPHLSLANTIAMAQHRLGLVLGGVATGVAAWLTWLASVVVVAARRHARCDARRPLDASPDPLSPHHPPWVPTGPAHRAELTGGASPYRSSAAVWVGSPSSIVQCALERVAPVLAVLMLMLLPGLAVGAAVTWLLSPS